MGYEVIKLEYLAAIAVFLAGIIFSQLFSISFSSVKFIESFFVTIASCAAIFTSFIAYNAYKSWNKPAIFNDLKDIVRLLEEDYLYSMDVERECNELIWKLKKISIDVTVEDFDGIVNARRKFLMGRSRTLLRVNSILDSNSGAFLLIHKCNGDLLKNVRFITHGFEYDFNSPSVEKLNSFIKQLASDVKFLSSIDYVDMVKAIKSEQNAL
ncbi:hypothetical protein I6M28_03090 [Shewanella algae]|nr:hypothetical protein [Shewanella algae]